MEKSVKYPATYFSAEILRDAVSKLDDLSENSGVRYSYLRVSTNDATWTHDDIEEFWADYRRSSGRVDFGVATRNCPERTLSVVIDGESNNRETAVFVSSSSAARNRASV